jgi:transcriptional regulator with XRE-family HTH domain
MKGPEIRSITKTVDEPPHAVQSKSNHIDVLVGSKVKLRRQELGLSQTKLAQRLGLTFQQIQKYENGTNRMGASRLLDVSLALHVPIEYFYEPILSFGDAGAPHVGNHSGQAVAMNKNFARITSAETRAQIIELVRSLAPSKTPA